MLIETQQTALLITLVTWLIINFYKEPPESYFIKVIILIGYFGGATTLVITTLIRIWS